MLSDNRITILILWGHLAFTKKMSLFKKLLNKSFYLKEAKCLSGLRLGLFSYKLTAVIYKFMEIHVMYVSDNKSSVCFNTDV